jgi:GNAT superfamily N-acetyltransferase
MDRLHIRRGTHADSGRILDLLKLSLGEGRIPRELAYWNWKHLQNPFGESPMLLAESEGELVGVRVFMRWEWLAGDVALKSVRAVDTATHPRWQGKGIFSSLTRKLVEEMREEGVHFIFNTPNEKSRPGYLKMGWKIVGRTDLWVRPNRPWRIGRSLLLKSSGRTVQSPDSLGDSRHFQTVDELCGDPGVVRFLGSLDSQTEDIRLTTPRTPDYLRWRYAAIPGFTYHTLFETSGEDGAIVVFRQKSSGAATELRICELIVGHRQASRTLAGTLLNRLHKHEQADYLSAIAPARTPERSVLLRKGYLPTFRLGPILTVNPLNALPGGIDPAVGAVWRFSIGDLELF